MAPDSGVADLGRYRLDRLLGRGGMGEVYLAHDQQLDRDVAIKFVAGLPEDAARRVLREARAAAVLDHPCICTVYETGQAADGRPFIVMQYAEGEPLADLLERGPLPVAQALSLCASIARALAVAHRRGLVHRDLKPSNVVITPDGSPRLLDFGIARRVVQPDGASDQPTMESGVTAVGSIVGTPAYMSPEQIQQRPIDGRSDLFSLGAVLYESLTGRRAFEGSSPFETLSNVLHVEPPAPSTLRAGLDGRHDELCRRLMAKEPSNRFGSAAEAADAIAAIAAPAPVEPTPGFLTRRRIAAAAIVLAVAAVGAALWNRTPPLPPVPPDAQRWYERGVDAMREGSYETARRALEQAVQIHQQYVLAYARLADAYAELDDERSAQEHLLRVSELLPDESRLPELERLRLRSVRAAVLRRVDEAIALQREVVEKDPQAGAWVDLGRIQESAGLRTDARQSYARAVDRDPQSAAAHLRLGSLEGLEYRTAEAMASFDTAERLYRAASDVEGQAEVSLRRGIVLDASGDYRAAEANLDRASALSRSSHSLHQQLRARLALSRVIASRGRFSESQRMVAEAVNAALGAGLYTLAANGLVDLGATLDQLNRSTEAADSVRQALTLAQQQGARRTAARAQLQLASWGQQAGQSRQALLHIEAVLPFLREHHYRQMELVALQIATRAQHSLGDLDQAQESAMRALAMSEAAKDDFNVALASTNLARIATIAGDYPAALQRRLKAEAIHTRLEEHASLPYDLVNRAELLIRLGRYDDAEAVLVQVDAAAASGGEGYAAQAQRVAFLRGFAATTRLDCREAMQSFSTHGWTPEPSGGMSVLASLMNRFCQSRLRRRADPATNVQPTDLEADRERLYWLALTALEEGQNLEASRFAERGLRLLGSDGVDELRWRFHAVAAAAARSGGAGDRMGSAALASRSLSRLRASWKAEFVTYESRADVVYLMRRAGLDGGA